MLLLLLLLLLLWTRAQQVQAEPSLITTATASLALATPCSCCALPTPSLCSSPSATVSAQCRSLCALHKAWHCRPPKRLLLLLLPLLGRGRGVARALGDRALATALVLPVLPLQRLQLLLSRHPRRRGQPCCSRCPRWQPIP